MYTSVTDDKDFSSAATVNADRGLSGTINTDRGTSGAVNADLASEETGRCSNAAGRIALNYLAAAVICAATGLIYELFSHGVWSTYMTLGWMFPLVLGTLPNLIIRLTGAKEPGVAAENVYACGIATFTVGCMLKGVLEIFGTTSHLLKVYPIAGTALIAAGAIIYLFGMKKEPVRG